MSNLYTVANADVTRNNAQVIDLSKKTETITTDDINAKLADGTATQEGLLKYSNYFQGYHFTQDAETEVTTVIYSVDITVDMEEEFLFEGSPSDTLIFLCAKTTEWLKVRVVTPQEYTRILSQHSDEINQAKDLLDYLELPFTLV